MNKEFDTEKPLSFFKDLNESRLIPSRSHLSSYSLRDVTDAVFLYFIVLYIFKQDVRFAPIVDSYVERSYVNANFDNFMIGTTDLRIFLTALMGGNDDINNRLSDKEANAILRQRLMVDKTNIVRYLRSLQNPRINPQEARLLYSFEKELLIDVSNYRSVRRLAVDWIDLNKSDRRLVITRLLQAFRTRFRKSDLLPHLEQLAKDQNLEMNHVVNAETGEEPDTHPKRSLGKEFLKGLGITLAGAAVGAVAGYMRGKKG